ncbi:Membrane-bound lytic murein transglycosylase E [Vibrio owensii]|uniref:transglycosylase SLT domain-containing protein n=1 Tax=Vibrio owensii TaxID=696485 RepID=UPI002895AA45|nr:Membrane-bound lytic murein transglycosylase E [Vibrio owensii]CAH1587049.1 Membrane-bound lytic murein transglycosylase E [Vibrio owensii]
MTAAFKRIKRALAQKGLIWILTSMALAVYPQANAKMTKVDQQSLNQQNRHSLQEKKLKLKTLPSTSRHSGTQVVELRGTTEPTKAKAYNKVTKPTSPAALQYLPMISEAATQWKIETALLLAIIHTESAFNPNAVSHKDAIGLMQVMQNGGALEVSQKLYFGRKISRDELFEPNFNIDTGAAYLHILKTDYLHSVRSEQNKMLLAIAAYNCGLSNLMRYLSYTQSLPQFSSEMNRLTEDELYFRLTQTLPIEETRKYVEKVMRLYHHYQKRVIDTL